MTSSTSTESQPPNARSPDLRPERAVTEGAAARARGVADQAAAPDHAQLPDRHEARDAAEDAVEQRAAGTAPSAHVRDTCRWGAGGPAHETSLRDRPPVLGRRGEPPRTEQGQAVPHDDGGGHHHRVELQRHELVVRRHDDRHKYREMRPEPYVARRAQSSPRPHQQIEQPAHVHQERGDAVGDHDEPELPVRAHGRVRRIVLGRLRRPVAEQRALLCELERHEVPPDPPLV